MMERGKGPQLTEYDLYRIWEKQRNNINTKKRDDTLVHNTFNEHIVYVARSGNRFHDSDCNGNMGLTAITISKAKEKGYKPANCCDPYKTYRWKRSSKK